MGISVATPRCRRIRPITAASSMSAIRRRWPPHRGHASTSNPKVRAISDAQHWPRAWRRAVSAGSGSPACSVADSFNSASRPSCDLVPNHVSPPGRPGPQHAVVQHQVDARPRHEHGQPSQKLDGVEHDVRRPIHAAGAAGAPVLVGQVEPLLRHRRTQRIATHALEPIPLPGRHDEARMEVKPVGPCVTSALRGCLALLGPVARTTAT